MGSKLQLTFLYLLISFLLIFASILPLSPTTNWLIGPDVLLALTIFWLMRNPESLPLLVLVGIFLIADFSLMRAPGLMTAAIVLVAEFLKSREDLTTEIPFVVEWMVASAMIASLLFGVNTILVISGSPAPSLVPLALQTLTTIATYPIIVICLKFIPGLGRRKRRDSFGFGGST